MKKDRKTVKVGTKFYHFNIAQAFAERLRQGKRYKPTSRDAELIANPAHFLSLFHYRGDPITLSDFQISWINSPAKFKKLLKCRQLGFSTFCLAGKAVAKAHQKKSTQIFVSYNLKEAQEKIETARELADGAPKTFRLKLIRDNMLELKFSNNSVIRSMFSARGQKECDIDLDEVAFYKDLNKVYNECFPIVNRHHHLKLAMGSTPFGKNKFYEILTEQEGKFSDFETHIWYWWDSDFYCHNVKEARLEAHMYSTDQRVAKFGTDTLKQIYANMLPEDFQQEFEGYFADDSLAYFPYSLIQDRMCFYKETDDGKHQMQSLYPRSLDEIKGWNKGTLYAGLDIGRVKDTSEFYVFDYRKKGKKNRKLVQVFNHSMGKTEFSKQEAFCVAFLKQYGHRMGALQVDQTGIGRNLAENLKKKFPRIVNGIDFTNSSKERMASSTKMFMLKQVLELFPEPEMVRHFHSIKQTMTPLGNYRFDCEKTTRHHADKFWSVALACDAAADSEKAKPKIYLIGG